MTQVAIVIPPDVWESTLDRLKRLEERDRERGAEPDRDAVLTVREVAARLHVTEESVRRARRDGRLTGFKINEKEYGFRAYEVSRYMDRYKREL
ncbi:helix-turn-helix domain-containing protein [Spirosoma sordidisoli]|uniref:DNA-binding protein n=1 Tax=Spirosoma sordidisoli TaxID=2502893 RepID=A0A4Q2ULJ8_9BACT|nr:helix-turn-helix domain-containing protein [Spirosoma sordidisoli]RYC70096.1 DNA-binding protein [Spirosoma sordidisoli]